MTDQITPPEEAPKTTRTPRAKAESLPQDINSIIPLIREELGIIEKDQKATGGGANYAFRGHDQVVNAIVPLFNKYGVYTTVEDESLYYDGRNAGTKYATASLIREAVTFWAPDGSNRTTIIVAESVDYGNKATGQASTYAYRLALTKTFTIPTGEADPDASNEQFEATSAAPPAPAAPVQPQAAAPAQDDEIKALKTEITKLFKDRDIVNAKEISERGTKFFNGRNGWDTAVPALTKLRDALARGEAVGD